MIDEDFLIKTVLAQYHIVNCESQKDIPGWGKTIRNILISNGESYFLKEKVPYLTSKEFITKIIMHNLLQLNLGPVSVLATTRDEKQYTKIDNRYFELHEWAPGRFINYNCINEIRTLGEYTGILTNKLKILYQNQIDTNKFPNPRARSKYFPDTIHSIKRYFNNLFLLHSANTGLQVILLKLYTIVNEAANIVDWHSLPESMVHGDLSSDNAIFNLESGNVTFIDFDNIRVSKRIWDIARLAAILGSFYENKIDKKKLNTEFAYDKVSGLLAGYTQNFELNQIEKSSLTKFIIINLVLAFLSEFDIDDLENSIFSEATIRMEFDSLLGMIYSLLKNDKIFR